MFIQLKGSSCHGTPNEDFIFNIQNTQCFDSNVFYYFLAMLHTIDPIHSSLDWHCGLDLCILPSGLDLTILFIDKPLRSGPTHFIGMNTGIDLVGQLTAPCGPDRILQ